MKNRLFFTIPFIVSLPLNLLAKEKPNVIFILADDLGYGDLGYTGAPDISTPNIDAIASEGIEYTNYYSSGPTSTPTRCALLTGRYQARFKDMEEAFFMGVDHIGLPKGEETIARALQRNGYVTALIGKWHLGALPELRPNNFGFDYFTGFLAGNTDYHAHCEKNQRKDLYEQKQEITSKEYMTDYIADKSIAFMRENKEKPFFMYVAFNAPHWPYQGPGDGPCAADGHDWMEGSREKLVEMIEYADKRIGDILQELKKLGIDDNTMVIFSSDNGGDKFARNLPFKGGKGLLTEGGIHLPLAVRWKGVIDGGQICDSPLISMDISATILSVTGSSFNSECDGISFFPMKSEKMFEERPLFWRTAARKQYAVRLGKYKLFCNKGKTFVYDLDIDKEEKYDLSDNKEILLKLQSLYNEWENKMPYKQEKFGAALRLK